MGVVIVDGFNVNQSLIQAGLAWQYRKYCKASFCNDWLKLEKKVKSSRVGVWSDSDPITPWEWRKGARNSSFLESAVGIYLAAGNSFHGNIKSHVFHSSSCRYFNCKSCIEKFSTRKDEVVK